MTFQDDVLEDVEEIINGEFSYECIHTPKGGAAQPPFNCLKDETILHGDSVTEDISLEGVHITVLTSEVTAVKQWDSILLTGVDYEVVGNPYIDLGMAGTFAIDLRRGRLDETRI